MIASRSRPHRWSSRLFRPGVVVLGLVMGASLAGAGSTLRAAGPSILKKLTLEELMQVEVVSVSRHAEKLSEAASGIQVITGEEIRRAGAATLPQALRLASNLHAHQLSTSYWNIGARGTNTTGGTSNKLLVMIDGRTVYSPLVTGTYWDQRDVFLPDIDRIEVISGPGGSTWGANAVNGVINILTKSAAETQGGLIYMGAGLEERALAGLRYGGTLGSSGHYRVYAKHLDYDGRIRPNGDDAQNRWVFSQTGFRTDSRLFDRSDLTLSGDFYHGWIEQRTSARGEFNGGDLQARWTLPVSPDSKVIAQAFYDSARRGAPTTFADRLDMVDIDVQHETLLGGGRQRLVWGVGHRVSDDEVRNLPTQAFIPAKFIHRLSTAFVHDEFDLVPGRLRLALGIKYEHNNYSGSDHQPSARLAWLIAPQQTIWTAVSRAVRTPSRVDRDLYIPPQPPFVAAGGARFGSETLHAYELGWRGRLFAGTSVSLTGYVHDYEGLRTLEQPVPLSFRNGLDGRTYGAEFSFRHQVSERANWSLGYILLKKDFELKPWSRDLNGGKVEAADPEHQAHLRVSCDLPGNWEFDGGLRYVSPLPTLAARVQTNVPAYTELDARIGWVSERGWEISVIGTSLLDKAHAETGPANNRREIERSVHARITWRF